MSYILYEGDLPNGLNLKGDIAIDTETMGLNHTRDRLCLVQLSDGDGVAHLVHFAKGSPYHAPNLKSLLNDKSRAKIMHFARFDLASIYSALGVMATPVFCTKIASKLARTFTDKHGLGNLCSDLLDIEISKQQQTSDWGGDDLSDKQLEYAANDVLYLHELKEKLTDMLIREERLDLANAAFDFLPTRAQLDILGWQDNDIFSHG